MFCMVTFQKDFLLKQTIQSFLYKLSQLFFHNYKKNGT